MYCRLRWEMEIGLGVPCQNSHISEQNQGTAVGAEAPQRHPECAQGRERNGAAALNEKPGGPVKRSRRKE